MGPQCINNPARCSPSYSMINPPQQQPPHMCNAPTSPAAHQVVRSALQGGKLRHRAKHGHFAKEGRSPTSFPQHSQMLLFMLTCPITHIPPVPPHSSLQAATAPSGNSFCYYFAIYLYSTQQLPLHQHRNPNSLLEEASMKLNSPNVPHPPENPFAPVSSLPNTSSIPASLILIYPQSWRRNASSSPAENRALGFSQSFQKQEVLQPISTKISLYNASKNNFPVLTPNTASLRKYWSFLN